MVRPQTAFSMLAGKILSSTSKQIRSHSQLLTWPMAESGAGWTMLLATEHPRCNPFAG